jgi:hypothetical protein
MDETAMTALNNNGGWHVPVGSHLTHTLFPLGPVCQTHPKIPICPSLLLLRLRNLIKRAFCISWVGWLRFSEEESF